MSILVRLVRNARDFVRQNLVDFLFVYLVAAVVVAVLVRRALLSKYLEAIDGRNVGERAFLRVQIGICLEEDVWEAESEVGAVNVEVLLTRHVHLLAARTIGLSKKQQLAFVVLVLE